jgi:hypothetical protein
MSKFGKFAGAGVALYQITDNTRVLLTPTGKMGAYSTYEMEGNTYTLSYGVTGVRNMGWVVLALVLLFIVFVILVIVIVVNIIKRHGGKVPKIFNRFIVKVSDKIESKEQLFYNDTDPVEERVQEKFNERVEEIRIAEEAEAELEEQLAAENKFISEVESDVDDSEQFVEEEPVVEESLEEEPVIEETVEEDAFEDTFEVSFDETEVPETTEEVVNVEEVETVENVEEVVATQETEKVENRKKSNHKKHKHNKKRK